MQTPLEIDFQGFTPNDRQKAAVEEHIKLFEKRFGRIISGRIVAIGPGGHHHTGGLYEINIRLRLPTGKEVDASRTPHVDERHSDFDFALNDAFKRARRQLQGKVGRLEVISFREPEEYMPRGNWYGQFQGRQLDRDLEVKRGIHPVTGATLTVRATTDAVRRVLALHQVISEGKKPS